MNAACFAPSLLCTPCICPFLIMCIASYPCNVRQAVSKEKKPIPGLTRRLMKRWSCSTRLLRYLLCRSSQDPARTPAVFNSLRALGYAAFWSTVITRGVTVWEAPSAFAKKRLGSWIHSVCEVRKDYSSFSARYRSAFCDRISAVKPMSVTWRYFHQSFFSFWLPFSIGSG
jgi:hypothetical protein